MCVVRATSSFEQANHIPHIDIPQQMLRVPVWRAVIWGVCFLMSVLPLSGMPMLAQDAFFVVQHNSFLCLHILDQRTYPFSLD